MCCSPLPPLVAPKPPSCPLPASSTPSHPSRAIVVVIPGCSPPPCRPSSIPALALTIPINSFCCPGTLPTRCLSASEGISYSKGYLSRTVFSLRLLMPGTQHGRTLSPRQVRLEGRGTGGAAAPSGPSWSRSQTPFLREKHPFFIRESWKWGMQLFVLCLLLGGSVNRIINLWRPQSFSIHWSGNWTPARVSHNETSKVAESGPGGKHHKEGTLSLELGSLPSLLFPLTHLLVAFAKQEAKSEPWFWEVTFQSGPVLRSPSCAVNHLDGRSP